MMDEAGKSRKPFLFAVDFEMKEGFFVPEPLLQHDVWFDVKGISNYMKRKNPVKKIIDTQHPHLQSGGLENAPENSPVVSSDFFFEAQPEEFATYLKRFNVVMDGLKRGDSYLTNLTIKTPLRCSLTLEEIFHYSKATYKLCLPNQWVCFSPECFVRIEKGKIFTFPMKGTIDASLPHARDIILHDRKETAEHNTIVDLLRNDLSRIASSVKVNRFRYIDELQTNKGRLLQVSSEIEGILPEGYLDQLGTLFFELLPAGSVSGAPKEATLRIIKEAENEPRGFYTGVGGYFDGENFESFVLIRFIERTRNEANNGDYGENRNNGVIANEEDKGNVGDKRNKGNERNEGNKRNEENKRNEGNERNEENREYGQFELNKPQLIFRSGGGITANSNPQKEYMEAIQKVYLPLV